MQDGRVWEHRGTRTVIKVIKFSEKYQVSALEYYFFTLGLLQLLIVISLLIS